MCSASGATAQPGKSLISVDDIALAFPGWRFFGLSQFLRAGWTVLMRRTNHRLRGAFTASATTGAAVRQPLAVDTGRQATKANLDRPES